MANEKTLGFQGPRGKRGHRGKRGPRGSRGHDSSGAAGTTGATGATGATGVGGDIDHVQDRALPALLLPANATTNVLTCAPITGPAGSFLQFTGMVSYQCRGNATNDAPTVVVQLKEDGNPITASFTTPGAHTVAGPLFDFFACIPIAWWLVADGNPHVYTVDVTTDSYSNGTQDALVRALFVNNVAA